MDNFDPYNVLLSIATNIAVLLMTAFVLQGHKWQSNLKLFFDCNNILIPEMTCWCKIMFTNNIIVHFSQ